MMRFTIATALLLSASTPASAQLVGSPPTVVCPSGALLNVEWLPVENVKLEIPSAGGKARLSGAERLSGDCAALVTQSAMNLYKLKSGIIVGSATGKSLSESELLPNPLPPVLVRQTQFGVGKDRIVPQALFDISRWIGADRRSKMRKYIAVARRGDDWIVADVERPHLSHSRLTILAISKLPIRSLGYMPFEHGPLGHIFILQEVGANELHKIVVDWRHGVSGPDDLGFTISR